MIENHPLEPFLPKNARVLFLGSFPPPKKRWCMDFFYPNFINDHWRIEGQIWFGDKNYFVDTEHKSFKKDEIVTFLNEKGIALFDTAMAVNRLKDNASDAFLEIVEHTDIRALLAQMPQCHAIATTGGEGHCRSVQLFQCRYHPFAQHKSGSRRWFNLIQITFIFKSLSFVI